MAAPIQLQAGQDPRFEILQAQFRDQQAQLNRLQEERTGDIAALAVGVLRQRTELRVMEFENERLEKEVAKQPESLLSVAIDSGKICGKSAVWMHGAKEVAEKGTKYAIKNVPLAAHILGEGGIKAIPVIGLILGLGSACRRLWLGHHPSMIAGEVASGMAGLIPGWGMPVSLSIDTALLTADLLSPATGVSTMSLQNAYECFGLTQASTDEAVIRTCQEIIAQFHDDAPRIRQNIARQGVLAHLLKAQNIIFMERNLNQGAAAHV